MAIEYVTRPMAAVQFHPESVLTPAKFGHRLIESALATLVRTAVSSAAQD
jgi:anthranilate/para-aminobenzoate synthase component II